MSSSDAPSPTPESNARDIAALTSAVDMLVSQFIRPATQQANANRETLDEVIELLSRHTQGLLSMEQRLDQMVDRLESIEGVVAQNAQQIAATAQQQRTNAQQIAQNAEAITAFDQRLEETRQLVAKNSSDFARMNTETKASIDRLVEENHAFREENRAFREESRAFRESHQSQLAAIIGNARRIDRLEQQAS